MRKTTILRNVLAVLAIVGWASAAPAEVLFTETFSYPNGGLPSVSGGLWIKSGGLGGGPGVSNGKVTLHHIQPSGTTLPFTGPEVYRGFPALTAGQTLYAGLDVSASGGLGTYGVSETFLYFASGPALLAVNAFTGSDFTFAIGAASFSTPAASWPNGLAFGATHRVVLSYEFDTGISKLWVNPAGESSTFVSFTNTAFSPRSAFSLWQGATYTNEPSANQVLDNLVLGTKFNDVLSVPASAFGDYNGDSQVDGSDFLNWQRGESPNPLSAADLTAWKANFGSGLIVAASQPVPEPASWLLALAGASITCLRGYPRMLHFRATC